MKAISWTAAFVVSMLLTAAAVAETTQYQLRVDGLACPFCAYGVEKELTRVDGVTGLEIDIDLGIVTVQMASGATMSEEQARQIVEDAGFTLRGFEEQRAPE